MARKAPVAPAEGTHDAADGAGERARAQRPAVLGELKRDVEFEFARLFYDGDVEAARDELNESVRDLIVWERNTIWRDMLLNERRVRGTHAKRAGGGGAGESPFAAVRPLPFLAAVVVLVGVLLAPRDNFGFLNHGGGGRHPSSSGWLSSLSATAARGADDGAAAQRCLGVLLFAGMLWATEAVPLFVTSLFIPMLTVVLRVFLDKKARVMSASEAAHEALSSMGSPVIMLILGGYTIAAALSKYAIDKSIAVAVLSRTRRPHEVLMILMMLALLLSMVVSNVAAPVLLIGIILPVVRGLPPGSPFIKCALLGIACASNIGGMTSPIASPQNAIALEALSGVQTISFSEWIGIALPLGILLVLLVHALLLAKYGRGGVEQLPIVPMHTPVTGKEFGAAHLVVILTVLGTVGLWCSKSVTAMMGGEGIVALIPLLVFMGLGLLSKEDFNALPFSVVYLVAGGIVLGQAVRSSRLLSSVAQAIEAGLEGAGVWTVYTAFVLFTLAAACLMSHTVAAIIIAPILAQLGAALGHPRLLVMGGALASSGAMALPVSSFPNMACISTESETGSPYLHASDFMGIGVPVTLLVGGMLVSLAYVMMVGLGM